MIKAIDFFCGAGGLTRGLSEAGINVVAGVDNDERLRETYANNNNSRFIHSDIRQVEIDALRSQCGIQQADAVLYAACTPCQPFSTLNSRKGEDSRKSLLLDFAEIIKALPPDFVLVENVPGLSNAQGREIYEQFVDVLDREGFKASEGKLEADKLDAKDYGVPQTRKRFILLASRYGRISLPAPDKSDHKTVRDGIEHLSRPHLDDGEASTEYLNHVSKKLQPHHKRIVEAVPIGGGRSDVANQSILLKCHQRNPKAHRDVFGRMAWGKPSPTLTCRCTDVYCGRFIHPDQNRGITLREAAALQTFPDDYEFFGRSFSENSRQIGNAVPVEFAKRLGESILTAQGDA